MNISIAWNEVLKRINMCTPSHAIKAWAGEANTLNLVNAGINLVYRFEREQEGYYLRMTHATLRSEAELLAAIDYQYHLFKHHVPVCEPIPSSRGDWVESIQQGSDTFLAHVCKEVPGKPIQFNENDTHVYRNWGQALGQLHRAAQAYEGKHHQFTHWFDSLNELHGYAVEETKALQDCLYDVDQFLKRRKQTKANYGLTHGDHREGNVLSHAAHVHIIDFDLPSMNWFMEDFVRPFFHSIIHDETEWRCQFPLYLEGYYTMMPRESLDLEAFSKHIQMKCLEIYLWTKNNWSGTEAPGGGDNGQWLQRIYEKIVDPSWSHQLLQ